MQNLIILLSEFLREIGKKTNKKKWRRVYSCFLLHEENAQKLILELLLDIIFLAYPKYVVQYTAFNVVGILNNTMLLKITITIGIKLRTVIGTYFAL
jgi:hypothetical protein